MLKREQFLIAIISMLFFYFSNTLWAQSPVSFQEVPDNVGTRIYRNTHGSGFFDFNLDGHDDIFIVHNVSVDPEDTDPHVLLKNLGNNTFIDIASSAHVQGYYVSAQGFAAGDYNNDGHVDMAIGMGNWGTVLYRNNGNETFTDVAEAAGVSYYIRGRNLAFVDYNNDNYLDLFVAGDPNVCLFRNNKNGTFTDVHIQAGLNYTPSSNDIYGFAFGDVDNDGDVDLFACGTKTFSRFFINNGNGTFSQDNNRGLPSDSLYFGAIFFDSNNDGWLDLFARRGGYYSEMYRNDQDGTFTQVSWVTDGSNWISLPEFGGGISVADFDNDGYSDILCICRDGGYHKLFYNNRNGTFRNIGPDANIVHWGIVTYWTAPIGDYNNDGYLDIFFARCHGDAVGTALYKNMGGSNHWFHVLLQGVQSNFCGIGARLFAWTNGKQQMRHILGGDCYKVDSFAAEFGLGSSLIVDSLVVYWPSGTVQRGLRIPADTLITLVEQAGTQVFDLFFISGDVRYYQGQTGIPNVQFTMTGSETGSGFSDPLGYYSVMNIEGLGPITITPSKPLGADVGAGVVSAYDASLAARNALGLETLTSDQGKAADVDMNGEVEMLDASLIARYAVGLTAVSGTYAGGWRFEPASRTYPQMNSAYTGENYTGYLLGDVSGDWTYPGNPGKGIVTRGEALSFAWNEDLEISLSVEEGLGMLSADIWFRYDPEMLEFADALTTDFSAGFQIITNESEPGFVKLAMYGVDPIESGCDFLTLRFHDIAKPGNQTEIEWELYRLNDIVYDKDATVVTTDVSLEEGEKPHRFDLENNYPNPFNPETMIRYHLKESAEVRLIILDIKGRSIRTLVEGYRTAGSYEILWDGRDDRNRESPSGTYIGRLTAGKSTDSIKMIKSK